MGREKKHIFTIMHERFVDTRYDAQEKPCAIIVSRYGRYCLGSISWVLKILYLINIDVFKKIFFMKAVLGRYLYLGVAFIYYN